MFSHTIYENIGVEFSKEVPTSMAISIAANIKKGIYISKNIKVIPISGNLSVHAPSIDEVAMELNNIVKDLDIDCEIKIFKNQYFRIIIYPKVETVIYENHNNGFLSKVFIEEENNFYVIKNYESGKMNSGGLNEMKVPGGLLFDNMRDAQCCAQMLARAAAFDFSQLKVV